jgi:pSer/pThr/pTyr-binding forkhead associated (FHA) protein
MELTLKLLTGRSAGQEIKVKSGKFLIGRAEDCNLRPHSDLVSRHHCAILQQEGICAIHDFGSKNGTLINDERVVGQHELRNGDRLKIGNLDFEVQLTSSVGGQKRPKVKDVKDVAQRTASGGTRGGEEEDITDWLADEVPNPAQDRETRRIDLKGVQRQPHETPAASMSNRETTFIKSQDETTTIRPMPQGGAKPADKPAEKAPEPPAAEAEKRGVETAKKLFAGGKGKLVAKPANAPKDSREAANDALKKLFNTRK